MGLKANLTTSWEPFETSHHICHLLLPLERSIWNKLISAVTGCYICNDKERVLISLPTRHSGLVIPVFHETAEIEFMNSSKNHIRTYNIRYNRRQSRETQNWNKKKNNGREIRKRHRKINNRTEWQRKTSCGYINFNWSFILVESTSNYRIWIRII